MVLYVFFRYLRSTVLYEQIFTKTFKWSLDYRSNSCLQIFTKNVQLVLRLYMYFVKVFFNFFCSSGVMLFRMKYQDFSMKMVLGIWSQDLLTKRWKSDKFLPCPTIFLLNSVCGQLVKDTDQIRCQSLAGESGFYFVDLDIVCFLILLPIFAPARWGSG